MKNILMPSEVKKRCHASESRIKKNPLYTVFLYILCFKRDKTRWRTVEEKEENGRKQQLNISLYKQFVRWNANHYCSLIAFLGDTILIDAIDKTFLGY